MRDYPGDGFDSEHAVDPASIERAQQLWPPPEVAL
jgi:hypothetical protein